MQAIIHSYQWMSSWIWTDEAQIQAEISRKERFLEELKPMNAQFSNRTVVVIAREDQIPELKAELDQCATCFRRMENALRDRASDQLATFEANERAFRQAYRQYTEKKERAVRTTPQILASLNPECQDVATKFVDAQRRVQEMKTAFEQREAAYTRLLQSVPDSRQAACFQPLLSVFEVLITRKISVNGFFDELRTGAFGVKEHSEKLNQYHIVTVVDATSIRGSIAGFIRRYQEFNEGIQRFFSQITVVEAEEAKALLEAKKIPSYSERASSWQSFYYGFAGFGAGIASAIGIYAAARKPPEERKNN